MMAYLKKHKLLTGMALAAVVAAVVSALLPPQILRVIVDDVLDGSDKERLFIFACLYTGAFLFMGLMNLVKEALMVKISQGISTEIRIGMLRHINRLKYIEFTNHDSASMEAYFNNDVQAINRLITSGIISIITDFVKMVGIVISIFLFSRQFGCIVLVVLPFIAWFALYVRKRMFEAYLKSRELEGDVNHLVYENIGNMEAIKLYDSGVSMAKYEAVLKEHFRASEIAVSYNAIFPPVMEMMKVGMIAALVLLSGYEGGFLGLSVGGVVATITLVTDLFAPIENLGMELQTIQKSMAGLRRINEFFRLQEEAEKDAELPKEQPSYELRFEHVTFSYDGSEEVVSDFCFSMTGNDKITLKGRSGAGKSTIMKLAYGLLQPVQGRVMLNGVDVSLLKEEHKRGIFGIVYQEPFFSGETIYEELTLHREIPEEKVREALDIVGLSRIDDLHKKFSAGDFSTGELSLLNIARVILMDCKVLFLDEMNARIDPVTAGKIMEIMNRIARDKMVLSISHYGDLLEGSREVRIN